MRRVLSMSAALALTATLCGLAPAGAATQRVHKVDCAAALVPGVDLRGCDFSHRQLQRVNLSGANLSGVNFTGASLYNAVLFGANLTGADLSGANLALANFTGAKLQHANLRLSTVVQADFSGAALVGVASGGVLGKPSALPGRYFLKVGALFGPAVNLSGDSLRGLDLHRANLARANLSHADLSGDNLSKTILVGANLVGARLTGATITETSLHDAVLFAPNKPGVITGGLRGTPRKLPFGFVLTNGYLVGPGANLAHANLTHSYLPVINLTGADLDHANFAYSVLWGAVFSVTAMVAS